MAKSLSVKFKRWMSTLANDYLFNLSVISIFKSEASLHIIILGISDHLLDKCVLLLSFVGIGHLLIHQLLLVGSVLILRGVWISAAGLFWLWVGPLALSRLTAGRAWAWNLLNISSLHHWLAYVHLAVLIVLLRCLGLASILASDGWVLGIASHCRRTTIIIVVSIACIQCIGSGCRNILTLSRLTAL